MSQIHTPRVLVVDDAPQMRRALRVGLEKQGYALQYASSGEEALDCAASMPPDLVLLDLMLPDGSGLQVCKQLREWTQVPIIILSGLGEEYIKVAALDCGADDYLTKPFGMPELLARIRAVLRRAQHEPDIPILESGDVRLDQSAHTVTRRGDALHLTPTEYELLRYLMLQAGKVVTHRALLSHVWGSGYEDDNRILRLFVLQLRRKIEPDPTSPTYILTEPGVGYLFRPQPRLGR
jgi:two-component system KDP operon response regulator KdpE